MDSARGKTASSRTVDIGEDLEFQQRSWKVQRIGWIVMLLIVIAALLGLFGRGPLSSAHVGESGAALSADYERFVRLEAPQQLTLYVGAEAVRPDSTAQIWLDREWLAGTEVKAISPEPAATVAGAERNTYTFRVDPSSLPARLTFELQSHSLGPITGRLGVSSGPSYTFSQFSYP